MSSQPRSFFRSQTEPLSILRFPPHGPRAGRRAPKPGFSSLIIRTGIVISLLALFAVYTGLARGAIATAALTLALVLGFWLITMATGSSTPKRHVKT